MNDPLERAAQIIFEQTKTLPMHLIGRLVHILGYDFTAVFVGLERHGGGDYHAVVRKLSTSELTSVHPSRISPAPADGTRREVTAAILTGLRNRLLLMSIPDRERLEELALHHAITATELIELARNQ